MTYSDLAKCLITWSIARFLCESWASCINSRDSDASEMLLQWRNLTFRYRLSRRADVATGKIFSLRHAAMKADPSSHSVRILPLYPAPPLLLYTASAVNAVGCLNDYRLCMWSFYRAKQATMQAWVSWPLLCWCMQVNENDVIENDVHLFNSLKLYKIADKTLLSNVITTESHSMPNAVIKHHKTEAVNGEHSVFLKSVRIKYSYCQDVRMTEWEVGKLCTRCLSS